LVRWALGLFALFFFRGFFGFRHLNTPKIY
jgi:hypothetical protein